jgi:hypothetical protein
MCRAPQAKFLTLPPADRAVLGLDAAARRRGGVLRGVLGAPARLLGVARGGGGGGAALSDADAQAAADAALLAGGSAARGASLADMWIDFLQAQTAEGCARLAVGGVLRCGALT